MQAMEIKSVKRIGIAAVAIGTLAVSLVGANELRNVADSRSSSGGALAVSQSALRVTPFDTMRYLEVNTQLPAVSIEPVTSAADTAFLEVNTTLPTGTGVVARSLEDIRFLEMNVLPEPASVAAPDYRFLEMNILPGDDVQELPPSADRNVDKY